MTSEIWNLKLLFILLAVISGIAFMCTEGRFVTEMTGSKCETRKEQT